MDIPGLGFLGAKAGSSSNIFQSTPSNANTTQNPPQSPAAAAVAGDSSKAPTTERWSDAFRAVTPNMQSRGHTPTITTMTQASLQAAHPPVVDLSRVSAAGSRRMSDVSSFRSSFLGAHRVETDHGSTGDDHDHDDDEDDDDDIVPPPDDEPTDDDDDAEESEDDDDHSSPPDTPPPAFDEWEAQHPDEAQDVMLPPPSTDGVSAAATEQREASTTPTPRSNAQLPRDCGPTMDEIVDRARQILMARAGDVLSRPTRVKGYLHRRILTPVYPLRAPPRAYDTMVGHSSSSPPREHMSSAKKERPMSNTILPLLSGLKRALRKEDALAGTYDLPPGDDKENTVADRKPTTKSSGPRRSHADLKLLLHSIQNDAGSPLRSPRSPARARHRAAFPASSFSGPIVIESAADFSFPELPPKPQSLEQLQNLLEQVRRERWSPSSSPRGGSARKQQTPTREETPPFSSKGANMVNEMVVQSIMDMTRAPPTSERGQNGAAAAISNSSALLSATSVTRGARMDKTAEELADILWQRSSLADGMQRSEEQGGRTMLSFSKVDYNNNDNTESTTTKPQPAE